MADLLAHFEISLSLWLLHCECTPYRHVLSFLKALFVSTGLGLFVPQAVNFCVFGPRAPNLYPKQS